MKKCKDCNKTKPLIKYPKNKLMKDGHSNQCKSCRNIYRLEYRKRSDVILKRTAYIKTPEYITKQKIYEARPEVKAKINKRRVDRRNSDPLNKIIHNTRCLIINCFKDKGWLKTSKTYKILGCDYLTFFEHLKATFVNNYNIPWDDKYLNLLNLDHIVPLAAAVSEKELIKLNHHSNFQYLWESHNIEKSDKLDWNLTNSHREEFIQYISLET